MRQDYEFTKTTIEQYTRRSLSLAKSKFGVDFGHVPVKFFVKGKHAGRAYFHVNIVEFNLILAHENLEHFENTVKHEIAHLVTKKLYPEAQPHGKEFKHVFMTLGGDGSRTHNYDVSSVTRGKTYKYKCACSVHTLSSIRHIRAQTSGGYTCTKCNTVLAYIQ